VVCAVRFSRLHEAFTPQRWLQHGDTVTVGQAAPRGATLSRAHPGTRGVLSPRSSSIAIVGDVIFNGSIGRTDFPRGDHATLLRSIREQVFSLGDEVTLYPGHGPTTEVGYERRHNPFVQGSFG
jgi:hydroxyacylglutathione hydrolase